MREEKRKQSFRKETRRKKKDSTEFYVRFVRFFFGSSFARMTRILDVFCIVVRSVLVF